MIAFNPGEWPGEWVAVDEDDDVPDEAGAIFWVTYEDGVTKKRYSGLCVRTKRGNRLVCRSGEAYDFGTHFVTHWRVFRIMWPIPAGE